MLKRYQRSLVSSVKYFGSSSVNPVLAGNDDQAAIVIRIDENIGIGFSKLEANLFIEIPVLVSI